MENPIIAKIKKQFKEQGNPVKIPLMNGKQFFEASFEEDGVYVDNLKNQPFLKWEVFSEAVNCLKENGGQVKKGNAANSRLGTPDLDENTVEGYIASKVYGYKSGDVVVKRITPIASILAWAGICENSRGYIRLLLEERGPEKLEKQKEIFTGIITEETKKDTENSIITFFESEKDKPGLNSPETKLAEKVERIEELEEQLKTKEIDIQNLKEKLELTNEKISIHEKELSDFKKIIVSLEEDALKARIEFDEIEKISFEKGQKLEAYENEIHLKEGKIKEFQIQEVQQQNLISSLEIRLAQSEDIINELKNELGKGTIQRTQIEDEFKIQISKKEELIFQKEQEILEKTQIIAQKEKIIAQVKEDVTELKNQIETTNKKIYDLETDTVQKGDLLKKYETQIEEFKDLEFKFKEIEENRNSLYSEINEKTEKLRILEEKALTNEKELNEKKKEIEDFEANMAIKTQDLKTLAAEVMVQGSEIKRLEEKITVKERKINTTEAMLAASEEKVRKLEKQLSDYQEAKDLISQLKEKDEYIKRLQGTLASKEEEFSKINEENRKYKRQQKFASEGLKQIEEQKASKKWWKRI